MTHDRSWYRLEDVGKCKVSILGGEIAECCLGKLIDFSECGRVVCECSRRPDVSIY